MNPFIQWTLFAIEKDVVMSRSSLDDAICEAGKHLKNISSIIPNILGNKSLIPEGKSESHFTAPKLPF